jgi:ATP-binding cassette subfamily C protein LapB
LMDEPTSSMDAQSEALFLRQLHEAARGCTLLVVTHRPAVLELVDRVVVVDGGRIVMDGPKAAVLAALAGGPSTGQPGGPPTGQPGGPPTGQAGGPATGQAGGPPTGQVGAAPARGPA